MKFGFAIAAIAFNLSTVSPVFANEYPFRVISDQSAQGTALTAVNEGRFPVDLKIRVKEQLAQNEDKPSPVRILVPAETRLDITMTPAVTSATSGSERYHYRWSIGDPAAEQDSQALYRLPFPAGKQFRVSQAHGGPVITHNTPDSLYAVDIAMPRGTDILAARAGVVTDTESEFGDGGQSPEFRDKANYVRILHDDGTWAEYFHLQKDTVTVYPGERVEAGTKIGEAGTSGFSNGPHLHFAIQKNVNGKIISLPFKFYAPGKGAFVAVTGEMLQADYTRLATAPVANQIAPAVDAATTTGNTSPNSDQAVGRAE